MAQYFGIRPGARYEGRDGAVLLAGISIIVLSASIAFLFLGGGGEASRKNLAAFTVRKADDSSMIPVLVPLRNIERHTRLVPALFRLEQRPLPTVPDRAIREFQEIKGQFARTLIVRGHPVSREYLVGLKPDIHIRDEIPDGYSAVSIRVNEVTSVSGWAWPGAHVDVLWIKNRGGQTILVPIVDNAKILAAKQITEEQVRPGMPVPTTVTLLVPTDEARKIRLAESTGSLSLILRNDTDHRASGSRRPLTDSDLDNRKPDTPPGVTTTGVVIIGGRKFRVTRGGELISEEEYRATSS